MTKNSSFLVAIILMTVFLVGFKAIEQSKEYDYLTINQMTNVVKISSTSEAFQSINVKDLKTKDGLDFSPALIKVSEYEKTGWEYVESTTYTPGSMTGMSIVMRKEKQ